MVQEPNLISHTSRKNQNQSRKRRINTQTVWINIQTRLNLYNN
jgi:hypothetical protein